MHYLYATRSIRDFWTLTSWVRPVSTLLLSLWIFIIHYYYFGTSYSTEDIQELGKHDSIIIIMHKIINNTLWYLLQIRVTFLPCSSYVDHTHEDVDQFFQHINFISCGCRNHYNGEHLIVWSWIMHVIHFHRTFTQLLTCIIQFTIASLDIDKATYAWLTIIIECVRYIFIKCKCKLL